MGNEKGFSEGREKGTKLARNLYKPREIGKITYYYFLQADHLEWEKAGFGVVKVSVYLRDCNFFYYLAEC